MQSPTQAENEDIVKRFLSDWATPYPRRYETYLLYYNEVLRGGPGSFVVPVGIRAYSNHGDVVSSLAKLIGKPSQTKADFDNTFAASVPKSERNHATRALLRVALMIDCTPTQYFQIGDFVPRSWGEHQTLAEFVESCFPSTIQSPTVCLTESDRRKLKAWKLKARCGVKVRPTDNLAEHLVFDRERRTLKVFRHVGFLKAHLYRTRDEQISLGFKESLKKGTLPPQLLLETLDSIQYLLFPGDEKASTLLEKFIEKYGFDPNTIHLDHIRVLAENPKYEYLGDRLRTLLHLVDNPPPENRIVAWFERHTSERNALTVAILGLFLTALFGFLSLIAGIISVVFSIKQYNVAVQALHAIPTSSATPSD